MNSILFAHADYIFAHDEYIISAVEPGLTHYKFPDLLKSIYL